MKYRVKVAGKIFEGTDCRALIRRAVEAKRMARLRNARSGSPNLLIHPSARARRASGVL